MEGPKKTRHVIQTRKGWQIEQVFSRVEMYVLGIYKLQQNGVSTVRFICIIGSNSSMK